ncbi:lambda-exonuclease family protein [Priestia megaterium]|uniref:YqaJ viral recombinase family nuclease n=1 Tax=Priestia megaterium TaxID=1404 RepID=UPI0031FDFD84
MNFKAKKLVCTKGMDEETWLNVWRRRGIGGSDASAVLGISSWKGSLNVYIEKVEGSQPKELSEAAEWGHRHEPTIRQKFRECHPELRVEESDYMWQSTEHEFMVANVDGFLFHPTKGYGILEIKTSHEWRNGEWDEDSGIIPEDYLVQCQHYMAVFKVKYCYVAVLIGGNKYREFYVELDETLMDLLIEEERKFWFNHVLAGIPPEIDGTEGSNELLEILYPSGNVKPKEEKADLPKETAALINEYLSYHEQEKLAAGGKSVAGNKLKQLMGEYQVGLVPGTNHKVTWSVTQRTNIDAKAFQREYPELFEKYATVKKSRRLSLGKVK